MSRSILQGALALALSVCATAALAQNGGLVIQPSPAGVTVTGSVTVDGITYTADDIETLAAAAQADTSNLSGDLPSEVISAVLKLVELRGGS